MKKNVFILGIVVLAIQIASFAKSGPSYDYGTRNPKNCLSFDGVDDYVLQSSALANYSFESNFTIACWIKPGKNGSSYQNVISKSTQAVNSGYIFPRTVDNWSNISALLHINGGWGEYKVPYPQDDAWHHVAVSFNGSIVRMFIDGVIIQEFSANGLVTTNNNTVALGCQPGYGEYYKGMVDEVVFFNKAASENEMKTCMFGAKFMYKQTPSNPVTTIINFNYEDADAIVDTLNQSYILINMDKATCWVDGNWRIKPYTPRVNGFAYNSVSITTYMEVDTTGNNKPYIWRVKDQNGNVVKWVKTQKAYATLKGLSPNMTYTASLGFDYTDNFRWFSDEVSFTTAKALKAPKISSVNGSKVGIYNPNEAEDYIYIVCNATNGEVVRWVQENTTWIVFDGLSPGEYNVYTKVRNGITWSERSEGAYFFNVRGK